MQLSYPYRQSFALIAARAATPPWALGQGAPPEPVTPTTNPDQRALGATESDVRGHLTLEASTTPVNDPG